MCSEYAIAVTPTAVRNSGANGNAESVVKFTKRMFRRLCLDDPFAWLGQLAKCRGAYMRNVIKSTGYSPLTLTLGLQPDVPVPFGKTLNHIYAGRNPPVSPAGDLAAQDEHLLHLSDTLGSYDWRAFQQIVKSQRRNIDAFERALKRAPVADIQPDDFVLVLCPASHTLAPTYEGPFLYLGLHADSGLAILQSGTDNMLDAAQRGDAIWKVKPHLLRKYIFPFQFPKTKPVTDPCVVALVSQRAHS